VAVSIAKNREMPNALAFIFKPSEPSADQYFISDRSQSAIRPVRAACCRALGFCFSHLYALTGAAPVQNGVGKISASGGQVGSVTKLRFTRLVDHPTHPISLTGDTKVNWAYGAGNDFSKHAERRVRGDL
jgi:hypothetical protein